MGRITIFNSISAVLLGAVGAGVAWIFGREYMRWGVLVGGVIGFLFPAYIFGVAVWAVQRIRQSFAKRKPLKHDDSSR